MNRSTAKQGPRSKPSRILAVLGAIVGVVTVLVAVGTFLWTVKWWPFQEAGKSQLAAQYDNTNPARKCAQTASVGNLNTAVVDDASGGEIASVELRHSPECGTAWVRVTAKVTDIVVEKTVQRPKGPGLGAGSVTTKDSVTADPDTAISFSDQLYAPGCIHFSVTIRDGHGAVLGHIRQSAGC